MHVAKGPAVDVVMFLFDSLPRLPGHNRKT